MITTPLLDSQGLLHLIRPLNRAQCALDLLPPHMETLRIGLEGHAPVHEPFRLFVEALDDGRALVAEILEQLDQDLIAKCHAPSLARLTRLGELNRHLDSLQISYHGLAAAAARAEPRNALYTPDGRLTAILDCGAPELHFAVHRFVGDLVLVARKEAWHAHLAAVDLHRAVAA